MKLVITMQSNKVYDDGRIDCLGLYKRGPIL